MREVSPHFPSFGEAKSSNFLSFVLAKRGEWWGVRIPEHQNNVFFEFLANKNYFDWCAFSFPDSLLIDGIKKMVSHAVVEC